MMKRRQNKRQDLKFTIQNHMPKLIQINYEKNKAVLKVVFS